MRASQQRFSRLAFTLSLAWASTSVSLSGQTPQLFGKVAWTSVDRDDISELNGLTVDAKGRVFAHDSKESAVVLFGADGKFLSKFARKGSGPGETDGGCCAALDSKSRLWLKDAGNARYVVFSTSENGAGVKSQPAFVVRLPHGDVNWGRPLWFDNQQHVVSIGHVADSANSNRRVVKRFVVDSTGKVLSSVVEPLQTENITPPTQFTSQQGSTTITRFLYQPFGATELRADGPNGVFALAGSAKYSVRWFDAAGKLLRTLNREVAGPSLSRVERLAGDSQLVAIAKSAQTTVALLPFKLPERKPPLSAMFFDADGRLWVQLSVETGRPREADVYSPNGALVFHATWPSEVRLASYGFARGNTAWGISDDADGVPHVVRMEFSSKR